MDLYDFTIIGSGPTGLFAGFYSGMRNMRTKIIEALPEVGGQLTVLYPEKFIYDSPGYPKVLAKDLVKNLHEQTNMFNPLFCFNERVKMIETMSDNIIKIETNKTTHFTKNLLISAGIGAFEPNKLLLKNADKYEGKGIYYHVKNKNIFRDKHILIIGGGDTALDWALTFQNWSKKVTLIHRRDVFRAHESSVKSLFSSDVSVKLFWELKSINGNNNIESVDIINNKTQETERINVDIVLVNIGFKADIGPIKDWKLNIDNRHIIVDNNQETNIKGVFAAGDIAKQTDSVKLNLIATGFAQAATAVAVAKKRIDPVAPLYEHSSEKRF